MESLYGYAYDDKHNGKHENGRHDDYYPHGGQHRNKHDKDGLYNYQIIETNRTFTYDGRGSVSEVTGSNGAIWASYRYNAYGEMTSGKPQYNNVYVYNGESYNPNLDGLYLRARYYSVSTGNFFTEDSWFGDIGIPLTLNRYDFVVSSPLNYTDPSGNNVILDEAVSSIKHKKIAEFLYVFGFTGDIIDNLSGYEYDPDPTHTSSWFDADFYEKIDGATAITNSAAYLSGLTGGGIHYLYNEASNTTLGQKILKAKEMTMSDLCDMQNALHYAADTSVIYEIARAHGFII